MIIESNNINNLFDDQKLEDLLSLAPMENEFIVLVFLIFLGEKQTWFLNMYPSILD